MNKLKVTMITDKTVKVQGLIAEKTVKGEVTALLNTDRILTVLDISSETTEWVEPRPKCSIRMDGVASVIHVKEDIDTLSAALES